MLDKLKKNRKGFTLIELMIVITVIAILAAIALISFSQVQKQARDSRRKAEARSIATALVAYKNDSATGFYPATLGAMAPTYISAQALTPPPPGTWVYTGGGTAAFGLCITLETNPVTNWQVGGSNSSGSSAAGAAAAASCPAN